MYSAPAAARAFANNDLYNRRLSNLLGVSGTKDGAHGKKKKRIRTHARRRRAEKRRRRKNEKNRERRGGGMTGEKQFFQPVVGVLT